MKPDSGHSDIFSLMFLLFVMLIIAAIVEGGFLVVFFLAILKWKSWFYALLFGAAAIALPILYFKNFKKFY